MHLEIVSHCWQYSRQLTYQLSSLVAYAPTLIKVTMTVFHDPSDLDTVAVLKFFRDFRLSRVDWNWQPLPREQLFRRAFGRNMAALGCTADWIWFADVDMVFRTGCLNSLCESVANTDAVLVYPRRIQISRTHEIGEVALERVTSGPALIDIDPSEFVAARYSRAIGGVQIVRGDVARSKGYCNNYRRLRRTPATFGAFADDRAFRRILGSRGTPIEAPELYRIRHMNRWATPTVAPAAQADSSADCEGN